MTAPIDWTKPLELTDGTPVTLTGYDREGDPVIDLPTGTTARLGLECEDQERCYLLDGTHLIGTLPNIRNKASGGYATPHMEALAKRPRIEKAARALATNDRGCDDDYWLYDEDVEVVLRETGATDIIRDLRDALRDATDYMDMCGAQAAWPQSIEGGTALSQAEVWLAENS